MSHALRNKLDVFHCSDNVSLSADELLLTPLSELVRVVSCMLEFPKFLVIVICVKAWGTSWEHFFPIKM